MNFMDIQLDEETLESAYEQINYYANLPKHIKGIVGELKDLKPFKFEHNRPAHIVSGTITVLSGKLNIPVVTEMNTFSQHNYYEEAAVV